MDRSAIRKFANSVNRVEWRKTERLFRISRVLKPGAVFFTGSGKINRVVLMTDSRLSIKADEGKEVFIVSAVQIKKMIAYFMRIRVVERKELEAFHSHSSAMFGLLAGIYKKKAKLNKAAGLLRLTMTGIRMFFSSFEQCPADLREAVRNGARYVLASYFYTRKLKCWRAHLNAHGLTCIMDSGAFSSWMAKKNGRNVDPLDIDQYISFIKANEDVIDHYFAFDHIGDYLQTMQALRYMEQEQLTPIPIYHLGSPSEILDELVDGGYPVIALGGTVNQNKGEVEAFFDKVFSRYPTQAFHGLGVSRAEWLKRYPFFSCDAKTWIYTRWKKLILSKDGQYPAPNIPTEERWNQNVKFWTSLERTGVYGRYAANSNLGLAS